MYLLFSFVSLLFPRCVRKEQCFFTLGFLFSFEAIGGLFLTSEPSALLVLLPFSSVLAHFPFLL